MPRTRCEKGGASLGSNNSPRTRSSPARKTFALRAPPKQRPHSPPFHTSGQYPGEFQSLLDTGDGAFRRILSCDYRPGLGEFKGQLVDALREKGVVAAESETLSFLRTGYKTSTWWEEPREEASEIWRR